MLTTGLTLTYTDKNHFSESKTMRQIIMLTTDMLNVVPVNSNLQGSDSVMHDEGVIDCRA